MDGLVFYLETIGVSWIMIWWIAFEKKQFKFWWEIWIQVVVILLQLYVIDSLGHASELCFRINVI